MKHDVVAFGDHPLELNVLARVFARAFLKIVDEALLALRNTGAVLNVLVSSVAFDGLTRAAPVEHEVVECDHVALVAFQAAHHRCVHVDFAYKSPLIRATRGQRHDRICRKPNIRPG